ncbi:MAG: ATP-binding cassette domain-containing protein [Bacteroidota bacterium]
MDEVIRLENVSLSLGDQKVLDNVSFTVGKCQTKAIIGPSGAGKSTLLKVVLGLLKPQSGSVWINGREITHFEEKEIIPIRRTMGIVFQANALFDSLTVGENIGYFLGENNHVDAKKLKEVVQDQLNFFNLGDIADLMPEELSGGMKKRVAVARAIAFNPSIILYDEPTTGLDPINAKIIAEHIVKLKKEKCVTSIVVTHVLRDAFIVADTVAMINDGKIIFDGAVEQFRASHDSLIQDFLA